MKRTQPIQGSNLDVWYNINSQIILICRFFNLLDGNEFYFDLLSDIPMDLYKCEELGFRKIKNNGGIINAFQEYTTEQLLYIERVYNGKRRKERFSEDKLESLAAIQDKINDRLFDLDRRYPVETLEIRYSEPLNHFMVLAVKFDQEQSRFIYTDLYNGEEVNQEILASYDICPRDSFLKQSDYSPRELIGLHLNMNSKFRR